MPKGLEGLEERLLASLDRKLADLDLRGVLQADSSPLSAADAKPAGNTLSTSRPRMPSTQRSMQQQQGEEEVGQQAAYERMQVSFSNALPCSFCCTCCGVFPATSKKAYHLDQHPLVTPW